MRQKKNLLTADFSTSQDWGEEIQLCGTENQVVQLGVRELREKRGLERHEEQEVDGKVIAVSTWSRA